MPHQIFHIDELLRLIIDELVATNPRTAVALAATCRSLEEPTLSSLWKEQRSLDNLVKVLPNYTWVQDKHDTDMIVIVHDPSVKDWARLHRYASWMRVLDLESINMTTDVLHLLSCNSPNGLLCPMLEELSWDVDSASIALTFFRLFLSPHLKCVLFYTDSDSYDTVLDISWRELATLIQKIISSLPTSLEELSIMCGSRKDGPLKDAISSFVCRCGSSLRSLESYVPLSEAAIRHLMQLPDLHTWYTVQKPPQTIPTSIFPSLRLLYLNDHAAAPWLHLLASCGKGILRNGSASATPHSNVRETLISLDCLWGTTVDSIFLSSVMEFGNLALLCIHTSCDDEDSCSFHVTDGDVNDLAAALPRLQTLDLGTPCHHNSCETTVASLLSISIRCLDLTDLCTHFNTLKIVEDIQRLLDGGSGCDRAKCKLKNLWVGSMPLEIPNEDVGTVAMGLKAIFPCLTSAGHDDRWRELGEKF